MKRRIPPPIDLLCDTNSARRAGANPGLFHAPGLASAWCSRRGRPMRRFSMCSRLGRLFGNSQLGRVLHKHQIAAQHVQNGKQADRAETL